MLIQLLHFRGTGVRKRYCRKSMLVLDSYSALAGEVSAQYVNLGKMKNAGWDFNINHRYNIGKLGYNIGVNISTYKNEVVKLNQAVSGV